ncbi:extracellular solute-binding protein [Geobacter pelophilus]|uniref:Extracellular solute-binding protein n=1 Tax=Geoanaerobacter pelophilus TaxID=60036 RepID=A0AAW4LDP4_9BACT|nr:extracellular solute-binding protein [Geoanaerobacter pelophilus]MBT0665261.1 extracellular solute-binding protein [Geoanaerobacter pelophilus]
MLKIIILTLCLTVLASSACAETIKIGGSGSMIPMLTDIAKAYMEQHPGDKVEVNQKSLGQPGGIEALTAGSVDIAMSAIRLTDAQLRLPLKAYEIARVAGVVAVTNDVPVSNISTQQLCDIYSGKIKTWEQFGGNDSAILVLTRPESDSTKFRLRKSFACMENLKESPAAVNLPKSQDMFNALVSKSNAIGIVDAIAMAEGIGKFKAIKIDGKNYSQYETGQWPYGYRNQLVVRNTETKTAVKKFLEFVKSPEGQYLIQMNKATPVDFSL